MRESLGVKLPHHSSVREQSVDFTEALPTEYRADLVIQLDGELNSKQGPVAALVVEIQLRRDPQKRFTWPVYVATLRARLKCEAHVLVVTPSEKVAAWCRKPISLGGASSVHPLVLGPNAIPVVQTPDAARRTPELGVLSVMAHAPRQDAEQSARMALAALQGLAPLDTERGRLYSDMVLSQLGIAAKAALEEHMETEGYELQSDWAKGHYARGVAEGVKRGQAEGVKRGRAEGIAEARKKDLRNIFEARGLPLSETQRERILACRDSDVLEQWIRASVTARSVDDVIGSGD